MEQPLNPFVHFFFFDKLTAIRLCDTALDSSTKSSIFIEHAEGSVLYYLLGIGANVICDLREERFLFRSEVYFHVASLKVVEGDVNG